MSIIQYTTASRYVATTRRFFPVCIWLILWTFHFTEQQIHLSPWEEECFFTSSEDTLMVVPTARLKKLRVTFLKIMVKAGDLKLYTVFQESRHSLSFVCARFSQMQCSIRKWVHISEHKGSPIFYVVVAQTIPKHGCNV